MEFKRRYPLPVRLYRGTTYILSSLKQPESYEPVIYDGEGFPVRWVSGKQKAREPIGFRIRRVEG